MNTKISLSKQIALGGMVAAITVLCLYAAAMLPVGRLLPLYLASLAIVVLSGEGAYIPALICFLASAAIAFLILPDKQPAILYALFFGHYGIIRPVIQGRVRGRVIRALLKLLYCDFFLAVGLYVGVYLIAGFSLTLPAWLPIWGAVLLAQPALLLYDMLYGAGTLLYQSHLRHALLPRM